MSKGSIILAAAVAILGLGGCNRPASHEMTEAEHDKMLAEKKRNANWGKSVDDAKRMEEISRQRAQQAREQK
ncbi:MAG: hypothetical protein WA190_17920 [Usitatibacter sp.]